VVAFIFSRTTSATRHQAKPIWILVKQETIGWQWHQLDHTQIICTSIQTDNHASTSSLEFLQAGCSSNQQCQTRFSHISGHPSAAGRAQDRESSPAKDQRSTAVPRNQLTPTLTIIKLRSGSYITYSRNFTKL